MKQITLKKAEKLLEEKEKRKEIEQEPIDKITVYKPPPENLSSPKQSDSEKNKTPPTTDKIKIYEHTGKWVNLDLNFQILVQCRNLVRLKEQKHGLVV